MDVRIIKKNIVGSAQVLDTLEKLEKSIKKATKGAEEKSLGGIPQKVKDSITKFSKLDKDKEAKLIGAIKGLSMARVNETHIAQIVAIMPRNIDELKTIFAGSKTTLTPEDLEKISNAVKQYEK